MGRPITTDYRKIRERLDSGLYEQYINLEKTSIEVERELGITNTTFLKALKMYGYQTKSEYKYNNIKHDFFSIIDTEAKAYILGFYLADGYLNEETHTLAFSITESDKEILDVIKNNIAPTEKIRKRKEYTNKQGYTSKPMVTLRISSKSITNDLIKYGIGNKKTYKDDIDISFIPDSLMIPFIRGYFDGDGSVYSGQVERVVNGKTYISENCNWSIISHCKSHLLQIQSFLFKEFSIKTYILNDQRGNFLVAINNKEYFMKFRDILYKDANFYLKRKKEKYFSYEFQLKKADKKVKVLYNGEWKFFNNQESAAKFLGVSGTSIRNWIKKGDKAPYLICNIEE